MTLQHVDDARKALLYFDKVSSRPDVTSAELEAASVVFAVKYRRAARVVCGFLPEAGYTSRRVALLVHWTKKGNCICQLHQDHRNFKSNDSASDFFGVAYEKTLNSKKDDNRTAKPLHMHCGCLIDDVLLEFFFWKTVTARSTHPKLKSLAWNMGKAFTPTNIRAFWVSQFKTMTNLTLDDVYGLGPDEAVRQFTIMARMIWKSVSSLSSQMMIGVSLTFDSPEDEKRFKELARL